jgi:hypothetical protein
LDVVRSDRFRQRAEVGRVVDDGNDDDAFHWGAQPRTGQAISTGPRSTP